jgi:RHS repeat-associated protein
VVHYRYSDRLISLNTATDEQYYHYSALRTTANLTNTAGDVQVSYRTDAWGKITQQEGDSPNRQVFTGQEHDENTGLIYFGARYYDPDTARFINQDSYLGESSTPPSLHRYLYAYGNPTVWVDPTGNVPVLDEAGQYMTDTAGRLIDQAANHDSKTAAVGLGVMAGANMLVGGVIETVNFGLNIVGAEDWLGSGAKKRATTELHQAFDSIQMVVENPSGTANSIVTSVKDTSQGIADGKTKSIAQGVAAITSLAGGKPNANVANIATTVANTTKSVAAVTTKALAKGIDNLTTPVNPRIKQMGAVGDLSKRSSSQLKEFDVGLHKDQKWKVKGLDSHHAGQSALMKKFVPDYNPELAPTILVNKYGHRLNKLGLPPKQGRVSTSTKGITNARDLMARDIRELRRVYPEAPNVQLKKLIDANKKLYPEAFNKPL